MYHANQTYYNGQDSNYGESNAGMAWSQNNGTSEGFNFNKFLQDQQHLLFPTTGFLPAGNSYLPFQGEPHYVEEVEEEENEAMDYEELQPEQEQWHHPEGPLSRPASLGFDGAYKPENPMITQVLRKPERQQKQTSIVDKAAELRAKVLASRTHKQGTPNRDKKQEPMQKDKAPEAGEAPTPAPVTRTRSVTDLDGLIAEERAAAETKAQQDSDLQAMSSGATRSVAEPAASSAEEAHQKNLAAAFDGHAGVEHASGSQQMKGFSETMTPMHKFHRELQRILAETGAQLRPDLEMQKPRSPSLREPVGANIEKANDSHYNHSNRPNNYSDETLGSTARHNEGESSRVEYDDITKHIEPLMRSMEQRLGHLIDSRLQGLEELVARRSNEGVRQSASHSHYFDDLDEWLDHTGYHDEATRKRELEQARKLAALDAQRAELIAQMGRDSHLTRSKSVRGQSVKQPELLTPIKSPNLNAAAPSSAAMAPPPLPLPKATRPSTDKNGDNNVRQGTKRPSEASLHEQMPADKVQRIDTPRETRNEAPEKRTLTAPQPQELKAVHTR
ncbi:hypothetical protein H2199_008631 [Coniosporium tulheliwenetii]|uniref:Uncharacterized protein n=1 Tax=Coniosporium tulheliwenetii TaxID=3383036 RepID=A0ACC2YIQ5_9PEZI|nr:hypothetical protein H2199_008631 [Cladosporium sp. JES 115]